MYVLLQIRTSVVQKKDYVPMVDVRIQSVDLNVFVHKDLYLHWMVEVV